MIQEFVTEIPFNSVDEMCTERAKKCHCGAADNLWSSQISELFVAVFRKCFTGYGAVTSAEVLLAKEKCSDSA